MAHSYHKGKEKINFSLTTPRYFDLEDTVIRIHDQNNLLQSGQITERSSLETEACVRIAVGVHEPPRVDPERFLSIIGFDTG